MSWSDRRLRRNFLSCLLFAQGVPLILAGDEVGNSQFGNNNAYCHDNEIGWVDWSRLGSHGADMTPLISRLTEWRRHFPQLQGRTWLGGHRPDGTYDVLWLTSDAVEMTEQDWRVSNGHFLSYVLAAAEHGQPPVFLALNASAEKIDFTLPTIPECTAWRKVHDTSVAMDGNEVVPAGSRLPALARSVLVFSGEGPRAS